MYNGNITLIGMPAAGKSTIGVLLAKTLGLEFSDIDLVIQKSEGRKLFEIIEQDGIDGFIELEQRAILGQTYENSVISTGGSAVYGDLAIEYLKGISRIVYLRLSFETVEKRLKNIKTRGIAIKNGQSLRELYEERLGLYEKHAEITVDCENKDSEAIVKKIAILLDAPLP